MLRERNRSLLPELCGHAASIFPGDNHEGLKIPMFPGGFCEWDVSDAQKTFRDSLPSKRKSSWLVMWKGGQYASVMCICALFDISNHISYDMSPIAEPTNVSGLNCTSSAWANGSRIEGNLPEECGPVEAVLVKVSLHRFPHSPVVGREPQILGFLNETWLLAGDLQHHDTRLSSDGSLTQNALHTCAPSHPAQSLRP